MRSARRRALVFGIASTLVVASFFACSFPDPPLYILLEQPDGASDLDGANDLDATEHVAIDATTDDAGSDAFTEPDASEPIPGAFEGGAPPVFDRDAGAPIDASSCDDANCDCDGDGYPRASCGVDAGKTDCDDSDRRYTPVQSFLDIEPDPGKSGDWNCDGKVEPYFASNEKCKGLLANCNGREGFEGNPGCGELARYVFCKPKGLLGLAVTCEFDETKTQMRRQACR